MVIEFQFMDSTTQIQSTERETQCQEDCSLQKLKQKVEEEAKYVKLRKKLAMWRENKIPAKGEQYLNAKSFLENANLEYTRCGMMC